MRTCASSKPRAFRNPLYLILSRSRADVRVKAAAGCGSQVCGHTRRGFRVSFTQCGYPFLRLLHEPGFVCARLEPLEEAELYGKGDVADSLPQKYLGIVKGLSDKGGARRLSIFHNNTPVRLDRKEQLRNAGYSEGIEDSRDYGKYK